MALSIKNPEADRLARELVEATGESMTRAIIVALRERLEREQARVRGRPLEAELLDIGRRCCALPLLDPRSADQILGYDDSGLPG